MTRRSRPTDERATTWANFELAARRGKFSVLGVYWPKAEDAVAPQPALF